MISPLEIETATYVSWPAFEQHERHGWVLRFADGCTKRANSVNVIAPAPSDLREAVEYCEAFYRSRSQPVIFRLLSFIEQGELDSLLADEGYSFIDPSLVLYRSLVAANTSMPESASMDRDSWLKIYCDISRADLTKQAAHRGILERLPSASLFTVVKDKGRSVACGLGVIHKKHFGIFDIVTEPDFRRKGHGTQLIDGMLSWACRNGASDAYVQVMANNAPAIRLYEKFGYRRMYDYWYRVKK